ncbi:hypothetical protein W97_01371 [Coniosporium apollinis CBS 100218]|uniref:3',5'-cyclic-nucleotide phosphodiesterase n=1 Tax=Coniosporium apollinis (strain CBS 100218) TaxID=1168221 RepID=R7YJR1_CONA1|nr:uncharacterized protein W97_01371 [Coniosporium apollinis CBS 100218]EON62152.1 hypothetical protein W97_01371 [Coniosporium apollinis CBS 100218]
MKDHDASAVTARRGSRPAEPFLQVICLGSGGGPNEDNVTAFLVRSTVSGWAKGSILAVDAGTHLAAITRILQKDFPLVSDLKRPPKHYSPHGSPRSPGNAGVAAGDELSDDTSREVSPEPIITTLSAGPFAGLPFPHASARANAVHVVREHVSTYLITHPHLDHLSGFAINTAAFHNTSRPKRLAALSHTVNAIKTHIFNDVIWPNLTDEGGGVGFVTFQRLSEGGNVALGEGHGRGYIEVCDDLSVKAFRVSHGHCMKGPGHVHRGSNAYLPEPGSAQPHAHAHPHGHNGGPDGREGRSMSFSAISQPGTPAFPPGSAGGGAPPEKEQCVIDSTAYFIRTEVDSYSSHPTSKEVLIFGDVEPDTLSLSPRNHVVWATAAPKIAAGILAGIFIECSYNDSQGDAILFGHLAPRHLIQELQVLADMVRHAKKELEREKAQRHESRKRKRASLGPGVGNGAASSAAEDEGLRRSARPQRARTVLNPMEHFADGGGGGPAATIGTARTPDEELMRDPMDAVHAPRLPNLSTPTPLRTTTFSLSAEPQAKMENPLKGLKVVIIHVKDTFMDGPLVGESILAQLLEHEAEAAEEGKGLGCEFVVSKSGASYLF